MTGNSKAMTFEERFVQRLKERELGALLGDEDALADLVRRAIREALWQPRKENAGFGRTVERDSLAIEIAKEYARDAAKQIGDEIIKEIMNSPEMKTAIRKYISALLPEMILDSIREGFRDLIRSDATASARELREAIKIIEEYET